MNTSNPRRNAEGYADPTCYAALTALEREQRRKAQCNVQLQRKAQCSAQHEAHSQNNAQCKSKYDAQSTHLDTHYNAHYNAHYKAATKQEPPKVYICSPYTGDTETNVTHALTYCRFALNRGMFPIAPHCYLPRFMNDDNPAERRLALSFGLRLLNDCQELWVFGSRISEGMKREIVTARRRGIKIKRFNVNKEEV